MFGQVPGYHTLGDDSSKGSTISIMSKSCGGSGLSGSKQSFVYFEQLAQSRERGFEAQAQLHIGSLARNS